MFIFAKYLKNKGTYLRNYPKAERRERIDLSHIPPYDYEIFEKQTFFRPYRGEVTKAVDYDLVEGVFLVVLIALKQ